MAAATYNVHTLALTGKNGYGYDERALVKGRQLDSDLFGLQKTRTSGSTTFRAARYHVFGPGWEKSVVRQGMYGVGLAVKESLCSKSVCTHQLVIERLMYMHYAGRPGGSSG